MGVIWVCLRSRKRLEWLKYGRVEERLLGEVGRVKLWRVLKDSGFYFDCKWKLKSE